jgi:glycosyltransferase involved in cell wall biosynthesis
VVSSLARHQRAVRGLECEVFGLIERATGARDAQGSNAMCHGFTPCDAGLWGFSPGMLRHVVDADLSTLHLHGLWRYPSVACRSWARATGRPYLISPHGMLDPWALRQSRVKKHIAAWLYERANMRDAGCLHALNDAEAEAIRSFGARGPIAIIPNGIDLPLQETGQCATAWDALLGQDSKVILFLGRIHVQKGIDELLDAWRTALPRMRDQRWHLVIAGWGDGLYEDRVREMVNALSPSGRVLFVGPLFGAQKDAAFRNAAAFVLPSKSEGLPMSVLEAWSYGLPVLMTDACNLSEGFERGAALRLPPTVTGMTCKLLEFTEAPSIQQEQMGLSGRALVEERFSWQVVLPSMIEVYGWLAGGGARPSGVLL